MSLIPLYLFLFIGFLFLLWGGEIGRWLKTVHACFSFHVDCYEVLAAQQLISLSVIHVVSLSSQCLLYLLDCCNLSKDPVFVISLLGISFAKF